jgi:hypothetical protein
MLVSCPSGQKVRPGRRTRSLETKEEELYVLYCTLVVMLYSCKALIKALYESQAFLVLLTRLF